MRVLALTGPLQKAQEVQVDEAVTLPLVVVAQMALLPSVKGDRSWQCSWFCVIQCGLQSTVPHHYTF